MTSLSLKWLPSIAFNYQLYKHLYFSYFSFDFDLVCGRLHGLIRACISDSLAFNVASLFKQTVFFFSDISGMLHLVVISLTLFCYGLIYYSDPYWSYWVMMLMTWLTFEQCSGLNFIICDIAQSLRHFHPSQYGISSFRTIRLAHET